ncbi:MAG: phospholipid carrier-dependent glycosyltransferase [Chloroflexi bacterium]|nr:phospholipid carrier-dependent glycosyltransferase [Chloroflexota bacterium]
MTKPPLASILTLGLLAVSGTFLILYATPQGMGLSDDSIAYIAGARSLLAGQGYREAWLASNQPVTHFPPGFSSALALVGLSGLDPLRGARFVNSLLFGANVFLLGLIGWRMTQSQAAGIALAVLFLVNGSLFRVHTTAMSEPLYIFFTLAAILSFSQYFTPPSPFRRGDGGEVVRGEGMGWLIFTAILTAFAYLTRYAGLALLAAFLISLFILYPTWRKRLTSIGFFLAGFLPFALAWSIRNRLLADTATNRTIVYHPITAENIETGISNFAAFLLPVDEWRRALIQIPNLFPVVISMIFLALLIWTARTGWKAFFQPSAEPPDVPAFISALYVFGYLASILSSMTLFDASTKFQLRILAPVYVGLLTMLVYFGVWLWRKQKHSAVLIGLIIFSFSIYGMNDALTQLRKGGQGYASFQWFDSEAMKFLQTLPEGTRIYSNETAPVYLYTSRPGYVLPDLVDPVTGLPRGGFEEGVVNLKVDVLSGEAVLALFNVGSQSEDSQSVYQNLTDGLYLAFEAQGDKIYTAFP